MSERDMSRVGTDAKPTPAAGPQLLNSKSVPALHQIGEWLKLLITNGCGNELFHFNFQEMQETNLEASTT
jgi:hypothetical protein